MSDTIKDSRYLQQKVKDTDIKRKKKPKMVPFNKNKDRVR